MHVATYITDQIRSSEYVNAKKKLLSVGSMFEDDNFIVIKGCLAINFEWTGKNSDIDNYNGSFGFHKQ